MDNEPTMDKRLLKDVAFYQNQLPPETAEEVTKAVKKKRSRPDKLEHTEAGDNTKYLLHGLQFFDVPKVDIHNPEEVRQRTYEYFKACADNDMKAGMAAYAGALGYSRVEIYNILKGNTKSHPDVLNTIKKAKNLVEQQYESYMSNNKINAVAGIFLLKNNFEDYTDKQEVEIKAVPLLGEEANPEEIAQKYMESLPLNDDL